MKPSQTSHDADEDELSRAIALRLIAFRKEKGLTIRQVAKAIGKSRSGIEKMEDVNQSKPTVRSIRDYAAACGKTLGEFFEPWLPKHTPKYDRYVQRMIQEALTDKAKRQAVEGFIAILEAIK